MTNSPSQAAVIHPVDRPQLPLLTSLRFFAALEVLLMHISEPHSRGWLSPLLSAGTEAVIFFFALSGFIMAYVYSGRTEGAGFATPPGRFWQARLARLLPAHVLGLITVLPIFIYATFVSRQVPETNFWVGLVLAPFFLQAWYPPTFTAWNTPAWSLTMEWMFYLLFPWLHTASGRIGRWSFLALAWLLMLAASLICQANIEKLNPNVPNDWVWLGGSFPPYYLPVFLLGMATGRIFLFGRQLSTAAHGRIFLIASAATVALIFTRGHLPPWAIAWPILVPLYCCIIYGGARAGNSFRWLCSPTFLLLGEASFAVYILHMPITWWGQWAAVQLGLLPPFPYDMLYLVALTVALSILSYRYFETPWRRRILGWRRPFAALRFS